MVFFGLATFLFSLFCHDAIHASVIARALCSVIFVCSKVYKTGEKD